MYNKTTIVGFLGGDPEMRYTPSGTAVTNFSVATTKKWKNAAGEPQEETTWFRVAAWGKLAEVCNQYLARGRLVLVEGQVKSPVPYQKNDGTWAAGLELNAATVKFLGGGSGDSSAERPNQDSAPRQAPPPEEDELPF